MTAETRGLKAMTTIHSGSALVNCNHSFLDLGPRVSTVISRTSVIKPSNIEHSLHTYINACMHTCIHICMHAYINTCMHTYYACMHTCIACMHTQMQAYMQTYIYKLMLYYCPTPTTNICVVPMFY